MGTGTYILTPNGRVKEERDSIRWARWFERANKDRILARTEIAEGVRVSTVFLGLDHNFGGDGPPILWETMIFGGPLDGYQERYATSDDAQLGHLEAVKRAREAQAREERAPDDDTEGAR